jgi:hypothetical protein
MRINVRVRGTDRNLMNDVKHTKLTKLPSTTQTFFETPLRHCGHEPTEKPDAA